MTSTYPLPFFPFLIVPPFRAPAGPRRSSMDDALLIDVAGLEGGPAGGAEASPLLFSDPVAGGPESVPAAGELPPAGESPDGRPGGVGLDDGGIGLDGGPVKLDIGGGADGWVEFVVGMDGAEDVLRRGGPFGGGGVLAELG